MACSLIPVSARRLFRWFFPTKELALLAKLRRRRTDQERLTLTLPDGKTVAGLRPLEAYNEYKDLFIQRIYAFTPARPSPRILDGGAYVGLSAVWFKTAYPDARLTAFECDPGVFALLSENIRRNNLAEVELVQAALAGEDGEADFFSCGTDGGTLEPREGGKELRVRTERLSNWLDEEVDFLKLNIEGAELFVLEEAGERLRRVREMAIEVHSFAGEPQILGAVLRVLSAQGFRYLVNHFDYDSNLAVRPPFRLDGGTNYITLVYAKRDDLIR